MVLIETVDGEYVASIGSHLSFMKMFDELFSQGDSYGNKPNGIGNKGYNEAPYEEPTYFRGDHLE